MTRALSKQSQSPEGPLTAAESACSAAERRFVYWLMNLPPKRGYKVQAYKLAGLGKTSTPHNLNSGAQNLLNSQRIVDLIVEVTKKQIRSSAPEALAAVKEIITDVEHRDRLKAAALL